MAGMTCVLPKKNEWKFRLFHHGINCILFTLKKTNGSFDCYIVELYAFLNMTFPPRSFDYDIVEFWLLHRWTTGWPFTNCPPPLYASSSTCMAMTKADIRKHTLYVVRLSYISTLLSSTVSYIWMSLSSRASYIRSSLSSGAEWETRISRKYSIDYHRKGTVPFFLKISMLVFE